MDVAIVSSFEKKIYILDVARKKRPALKTGVSRLNDRRPDFETHRRVRPRNVEFSHEYAACEH